MGGNDIEPEGVIANDSSISISNLNNEEDVFPTDINSKTAERQPKINTDADVGNHDNKLWDEFYANNSLSESTSNDGLWDTFYAKNSSPEPQTNLDTDKIVKSTSTSNIATQKKSKNRNRKKLSSILF